MKRQEVLVKNSYIIIRQDDEVYISNIGNLDQKPVDHAVYESLLFEFLN